MPPGWVRDLDEYLVWVERLVKNFGAWLDEDTLLVRDIVSIEDDLIGVVVERQTAHFADESQLHFDLVVNAELQCDEYHFTYQGPDGRIRWRVDKHPGHEDLTHIHFGGTRTKAHWHAEVDFAEVLERVDDAMRRDDD